MQRLSLVMVCLVMFGLGWVLSDQLAARAEQVGASPESGVDSRLKQAYDFLVDQGEGYGDTESEAWEEDWGAMWNRIMFAATWEPEGNANPEDVFTGATFYTNGRNLQAGSFTTASLFADQAFQSVTAGTEGNVAWTQTSSGGTPASVTLRGTTIAPSSNTVMRDEQTGLYWSDRSATAVSNNTFAYVNGDDRVNPTGNSCNFNSTGDANEWCNTEDTGVSATEFCLNLSLDAEGDGTPETDWRLPTYKELMTAYVHGSGANLSFSSSIHWSSTQEGTTARRVALNNGVKS